MGGFQLRCDIIVPVNILIVVKIIPETDTSLAWAADQLVILSAFASLPETQPVNRC